MKHELFAGGYGTFIGYSNGNIISRDHATKKEEEVRISSVSHVILQGEGVSISNAALIACAQKDIPVFAFDAIGRPQGMLHSPNFRREYQLQERQRTFLISADAVAFVVQFLRAKEARQQAVLHYHHRSLRRTHKMCIAINPPLFKSEFDQVHMSVHLAEARDALSRRRRVSFGV